MSLLEENKEYWTSRTAGYSRVNEAELNSSQKERWLAVLKEYLPQPSREIKILDAGTGPGFFAILLSEAGYDVTALDCTEMMLDQAKVNAGKEAGQIHWVLSDACHTPLKEESFHGVVSRNLTWNLQEPQCAYKEWLRVLKKGGILLNFDANWYRYLYDDQLRAEYEKDRKMVKKRQMEDHYLCTDIDRMEEIARRLPLSQAIRPDWDMTVLNLLMTSSVRADDRIWERVWSEEEKVNYGSTPMFSIAAVKK